MNGIGITEWRDVAVASSYPLENDIEPNSLFVDASFVQFDNFVPVLKRVEVQGDRVIYIFTLDDGEFTYNQLANTILEGAVITLRKSDRYYGRLVCGSGAVSLFTNHKGARYNINTRFLPITVSSIPSTAGLFSLQGARDVVTILPDRNQQLVIDGHKVTWNAVSKPSRAEQHILDPVKIYGVTSTKKFIEIDPLGSYRVLFSLPKLYSSIAIINSSVIAADNTALMDLTVLPPSLKYDTKSYTEDGFVLKALCVGDGKLHALTEGKQIITFNANLTGIESIVDITAAPGAMLFYTDPGFLFTSPGPFDHIAGKTTSDILYKVIPPAAEAIAGMFIADNDYHEPALRGIVTIGTDLYAVSSSDTTSKLYKYNKEINTGTIISTHAFDDYVGKPLAITAGESVTVTIRNITPLKTINGVAPINNAVQLLGSNLIQVKQTAADEITVSLAVDMENTTIRRSQGYE